ncbi:MAG: hypothetical protein Q8L27_03275 [archaeon]|nr:hypothetical protein [archaeon]
MGIEQNEVYCEVRKIKLSLEYAQKCNPYLLDNGNCMNFGYKCPVIERHLQAKQSKEQLVNRV